jgi:predicted DsbA family dithiol-disulfide isomerase
MRAAAFVVVASAALLGACAKDKEPEPIRPSATSSATPSGAASASDAMTASFDASALLPYLPDASLNDRETNDLMSVLSSLDAPCPSVPVSIAQCLTEHRACKECKTAADYLAVGVRDGWPPQFLGKAYGARFDPAQRRDIPIDGSPTKGPASAPITIVEFGSYTCPHCAAEAPILESIMAEHPKEIRLAFKPMWTEQNVSSMNATRAAIAAAAQGKFWEMHALIFSDETKESIPDLEAGARSLGLDVARFRADAGGSATLDRMKRDMAAAEAAKVDSLPSIWINGRELLPGEKLPQRLGFELSLPRH